MMCVFYLVLHQLPSWGELHSFSGIPQMSVQAEQGLGGTTADDALQEFSVIQGIQSHYFF